jgi:hypothetical protein
MELVGIDRPCLPWLWRSMSAEPYHLPSLAPFPSKRANQVGGRCGDHPANCGLHPSISLQGQALTSVRTVFHTPTGAAIGPDQHKRILQKTREALNFYVQSNEWDGESAHLLKERDRVLTISVCTYPNITSSSVPVATHLPLLPRILLRGTVVYSTASKLLGFYAEDEDSAEHLRGTLENASSWRAYRVA